MKPTWKMFGVFCLALALSERGVRGGTDIGPASKSFEFSTYDAKTIRENPTTQVAIRLKEWPEQKFLLWFPECVKGVWAQWEPAVAHQDFARTEAGGLQWQYASPSGARVVAELIPRAESLLLEVRVANGGQDALKNVGVQNCLHFSAAPEFACSDFSRIHIRSAGKWQTLQELAPTTVLSIYYRADARQLEGADFWDGHFRQFHQKPLVDHPLMVCTSKDGERAVATASEDYECVFHNQMPELRCIHSQQALVPVLSPGQEVVFRQVLYFVEGGVAQCLAAFERDVQDGVFRPSTR